MFFPAPNESLRVIIKYYMFKNKFGIKTTLRELLRGQKSRLDFGTTCEKDLVFARSDFLTLFGGLNESLRLFIIQYLLKHSF